MLFIAGEIFHILTVLSQLPAASRSGFEDWLYDGISKCSVSKPTHDRCDMESSGTPVRKWVFGSSLVVRANAIAD